MSESDTNIPLDGGVTLLFSGSKITAHMMLTFFTFQQYINNLYKMNLKINLFDLFK